MSGEPSPTGTPLTDPGVSNTSNLKIAIPRLKRDSDAFGWSSDNRRGSTTASAEKQRVAHACEPCRQRKTKCDGEKPTCRHCQDFKIYCYYGDGKRERAKNETRFLQERVDAYEKAFESLYASSAVDAKVRAAISSILKESANWDRIEKTLKSYDADKHELTAKDGSRGFTRFDKVMDDFGGASTNLPHGYLGQSSDMSWLHTIVVDENTKTKKHSRQTEKRELAGRRGSESDSSSERRAFRAGADQLNSISEGLASYHLDDLAPFAPVPEVETAMRLPERNNAESLLEIYFTTAHIAFPIIFKPQFMDEYEAYVSNQNQQDIPKTWLACLNLIFAIGSFYSQLIDPDFKGNRAEHLIYISNARSLFMDKGILFNNPDQQQVQALGLLGIYLLATKQLNRCWNVVGLALRNGYSLGMHLSSKLTPLDKAEQEIRHRKWYTLMSLERLCGILTGRPPYMDENRYKIPSLSGIPEGALQEMQKMTALKGGSLQDRLNPELEDAHVNKLVELSTREDGFLKESAGLYNVTLEILNNIYATSARRLNWRGVERYITSITMKLEKWRSELSPNPAEFQLSPASDLAGQKKKLLLHLDYLNALVLLNWPCLCRVKAMEAARSRPFNRKASIVCVTAALDIVKLLPDEINAGTFWATFPWWVVLYYIVSSGMIVMMEMMLKAEHLPNRKEELIQAGEKVLLWLEYLGSTDLAAKRGWKILNNLMLSSVKNINPTYANTPRLFGMQDESQAATPDEMRLDSDHLLDPHAQGLQGSDDTMGTRDGRQLLQQVPIAVPGIGLLARSGFDNITPFAGLPFRTIEEDPTLDPMLESTSDPQLWNWQDVSPGLGSAYESGSEGFPRDTSFTPNYQTFDTGGGRPVSEPRRGSEQPGPPGIG